MRGGRRPGAGRPRIKLNDKRITKGIRLPQWLWDWIDTQSDTRGSVIETALLQHYLPDKIQAENEKQLQIFVRKAE
jgi:hypothetical protein